VVPFPQKTGKLVLWKITENNFTTFLNKDSVKLLSVLLVFANEKKTCDQNILYWDAHGQNFSLFPRSRHPEIASFLTDLKNKARKVKPELPVWF
jgi:hypothetical protein